MMFLRNFILFLCVCVFSAFLFPEDSSAGEFIQTFAYRIGGNTLTAGDETILAKFDLIATGRNKYDDIGNTWSRIKAINPSTEIYLYQHALPGDCSDDKSILYLNNLGRWNISRGHSMGNVNTDNPGLFLLDAYSHRIEKPGSPCTWWADPGDSKYQDYWIEGTIHDLVGQNWTADGVFVDGTVIWRREMSAMPAKYDSDEAWAIAMHDFINAITVALHNKNQKLWCNRTGVGTEFGYDAYIALDNTPNPADVLLEEGVLAVGWGSGDVQYVPEFRWKLQIDIMSQIHNSKLAYLSHSELQPGESGIDNYGKPVTFWDIFWYAMGSYQIGKNTVDNNSYFAFNKTESYNRLYWYDEYDHIDLGKAMSKYNVTNRDGKNIYWREFEKGYVFVNPTTYDVSSISLPETCKLLTHWNFKNNPDTLSKINTINLKAHRAAMLLKDTYDEIEIPSPPTGLRIKSVTN